MRDVRSQGSNADGKDAVNEGSSGGPTTNSVPAISLPKGGGAIRGIGEKYGANPLTGTGSLNVPIATSPGRSGFGPQLSLSYDSGAGNGPFGLGWNLSLPAITRKTDKGLPRYQDAAESDVFILSGAEDLVPFLQADGSRFRDDTSAPGFTIHRYRPRIEGLFARIERWTKASGEIHWRSITRDNVTTVYGKTAESRIADPNDLKHTFTWLICESYDDKGNAIVYEYAGENDKNVDHSQVNERNRQRTANRYLKRINYGNKTSRLIDPDLTQTKWMFEVVFDYDEDHFEGLDLDSTRPEAEQHRLVRAAASPGLRWTVRPDPFSVHRAGFEVRTYRRCRRVLMFHRFDELGDEPYLVRSTEFDYTDLDYSQPIAIEDELAHVGSTRFASFIRGVTQSGYVRDDSQPVLERNGVKYVTYLRKSLPPLEFEYSRATIQDDIRELDAGSLENLPIGLDGAAYQWVDLDGEGVSGILTEQGDAWFYKPNLGEGHFGSLQTLRTQPAGSSGTAPKHQFLDLAGDGQLDVVQFSGPVSGFYERTDDGGWNSFTTFSSLPNLDWGDPNLRFVDLTGDGHADILITGDDAFTWLPSLAEEGFGSFELVRQALDEERGPKLVFADGTQSIYLADMCGDGLTDLVRIRNGEVCYWPNLGYGRFGAKVTMDGAPRFDNPDQFDQRLIRLADIDGSGASDIIYLGRDEVSLHFNQSGNSWSEPRLLSQFPHVDNLSSIMTADLLGNGTACLVWSSPLPRDAQRPMRYIDLMGGQKPHLLTSSVNNLGAETRVTYAASTKFYLADKFAGKPWITKIPFPVHVVERVETYDHISRNRFVTRYAYHHGYFDGVEREFRGFGMVEQLDTEEFAALTTSDVLPDATNIDPVSHVPPVLTKTWFHTGAWLQGERVSKLFEHEYYREGDASLEESGLTEQLEAMLLPDTLLPVSIKLQDLPDVLWQLTADESCEAVRSLKGSILRQEVYALDRTEEEDRPYSVSERNYTIEMLQPKQSNKHAVFFSHPREQIDFHYERKLFDIGGSMLADPRVTHAMTLEVDGFGNVLKSVAIGYGRRHEDGSTLLTEDDKQKQRRTLITLSENDYTNAVLDKGDDYRGPLLCEARTYQLINSPSPIANQALVTNLFRFEEVGTNIQPLGDGSHEIPYENFDAKGITDPRRRLIERVRTIYRDDDLAGPLPFKVLKSKALPFESYKLAFTPGLLSSVYQRKRQNLPAENLLPDPVNPLLEEGGYVDLDGDGHWWIPSGRVFFHPDETTPAAELPFAREHFFLAHRFRDPFLNNAFVVYDKSAAGVDYNLLITATRDAAGNEVKATNDYRVLQPRLATDPNGNRSEVAFDALGMVVGTAVMGKETENLGDSLDRFGPNEFEIDLDDATISAHLQDPLGDPQAILRGATTRLVYDLHQYQRTSASGTPQPNVVYALARETHVSDPLPPQGLKIQHSFSYSDGFGREMQKKIQAEPGPLIEDGQVVSPRWVGSGWTIFNNKGKPVRQYEPFFSATHRFEFARLVGVSPILFYDPVERVVATLHPNHTYAKVVFDPWRQKTYDVNDTVLEPDPKNDPDVSRFFRRLPDAEYLPTWLAQRQGGALGAQEQAAANKAAAHANTPSTAYFDTLGRPLMTVADNGLDISGNQQKFATRTNLDIEGNEREVIDAKDRIGMRYDYDMLGNRIHQASMEAGERWMLNDVTGKPIRAWDSRDHQFRTTYDALRRSADSFLLSDASAEQLVGRTVYGETRTDPETNNLRGKVVQLFDQAGILTSDDYDFKGNPLSSSRQIAVEYKATLDWSGTIPLEPTTYTSSTSYDALNRPTELTAPDNSVIRPGYNEANLLEKVEANLRGTATITAFVNNIDYDAKGQRERIEYGNGVTTAYSYDPLTFHLTHLQTLRGTELLQDLSYTYDPGGNITSIRDDAQQTVYFRNQRVEPSAEYTYDAIYRLIEATGREHLGQIGGQPNAPTAPDAFNGFHTRLDHPGDGKEMGTYIERYLYDQVGNFLSMQHRGSDPAHPGWTRAYTCDEASLIEPAKKSNRLSSTTVGSGAPEVYSYDGHGNMTRMSHLPLMQWDYRDQLQATAQQLVNNGTPETTWYVYDSAGQRVRKVTDNSAVARQMPSRKSERLYLGGFEIYREYGSNGSTVTLERETLHILDDQRRIALVETRTQGNDPSLPQLIRFQCSNNLESANLELDDQSQIISYEEYTPYGSTSYQAVRSQMESPKRYRYTGKERDEETGLDYYQARYYTAWLGRWTSCDSIAKTDDPNLYAYVQQSPIKFRDTTGHYREPGHYYSTYMLALAAGFDNKTAFKMAFYTQMPDEVKEFDATEVFSAFVYAAASNTGPQGIFRSYLNLLVVQEGGHALTGLPFEQDKALREKVLLAQTPGTPEFGMATHGFEDTFSHSKGDMMSPTGPGHFDAFEPGQGRRADSIGLKPKEYGEMMRSTYALFRQKAAELGLPAKLNEEGIEVIIKGVTSFPTTEKSGKEHDDPQIMLMKAIIEKLKGSPIESYEPEKHDAVSFLEFAKAHKELSEDQFSLRRGILFYAQITGKVLALQKAQKSDSPKSQGFCDYWESVWDETIRGINSFNNWNPGFGR